MAFWKKKDRMEDNKPKVTVSALTNELSNALEAKTEEAKILVHFKSSDTPKHIVTKIYKFVDKTLEQNFSEEELGEFALQMGSLWGNMVIKEYGWEWEYLDFGGDIKGIYIVSPNSSYCCPPLYFMNKILLGNNRGLDGSNDNTVLLLFNILEGTESRNASDKFQVIS